MVGGYCYFRKRKKMTVCMRGGAVDDDDKDDDSIGVCGEFAVKDGVYSPQEALSCRDYGCWWRWWSHFPFLIVCWIFLLLLSFRCCGCH